LKSLVETLERGNEGISGLFGWGGFGTRDLDLRAQIQILCLDDLKLLGFGFGPNPSWISKAQIHGFQMTCIARNLGNPPLRSVPKQEILKSKNLKLRHFKSIDLKSKSKSKYPNGTFENFSIQEMCFKDMGI
jgi:hypothetical protein